MAGIAYAFIGFETKGRSIEEIDARLAADRAQRLQRRAGSALAEKSAG